MQWGLFGVLLVLFSTHLYAADERIDEGGNENLLNTDVGGNDNSTTKLELQDMTENLDARNATDSTNSIKHKRCPRPSDPMDPYLGSRFGSASNQNDKKNIPTYMCTKCLNRNQCESADACSRCNFWCKPLKEDSEKNTITNSDINYAKLYNKSDNETTNEQQIDAIVSRSNMEEKDQKPPNNTYVIATFKFGHIKDIICRLVGIQDPEDIDSVIITVTTHSLQPPLLNNIDKIKSKQQKTSHSNKVTNPSMRENVQLNNFRNMESDKVLPRYPIDDGSIVHQIINPDIIEGPPLAANLRTNDRSRNVDPNSPGSEVNGNPLIWTEENDAQLGSPINTEGQHIASPPSESLPELNQNIDHLTPDHSISILPNQVSSPLVRDKELTIPQVIDKLRNKYLKLTSNNKTDDELSTKLTKKYKIPFKSLDIIKELQPHDTYKSQNINENVGASQFNNFKNNPNQERQIIPLSNRVNDVENSLKDAGDVENGTQDLLKKTKILDKISRQPIFPKPGNIKIDNQKNEKLLSEKQPLRKIKNIIENIKERRKEENTDKKLPKVIESIYLKNRNEDSQVNLNKKNMNDRTSVDNANSLNLDEQTIKETKAGDDVTNIGFITNRNSDHNEMPPHGQFNLNPKLLATENDSDRDDNTNKLGSDNVGSILAPTGEPIKHTAEGTILKQEQQKPNKFDNYNGVLTKVIDKAKEISQWTPPVPAKKNFDVLKNTLEKIQEFSKKNQKEDKTTNLPNQGINLMKQLKPKMKAAGFSSVPKYIMKTDNLEMNPPNNNEIIGSPPLEKSSEYFQVPFSRINKPSETENTQDYHQLSKEHYVRTSIKPTRISTINRNSDFNNGFQYRENTHSILPEIVQSQREIEGPSTMPNDIYFIGNGLKLPLHIIKTEDGEIDLSVDINKLCSCKNISCPANHTALEETVGTILEKEAELENELQPIVAPRYNRYFENSALGLANPLSKDNVANLNHNNGRESEKNMFPETKNNIINILSDSQGIQSENADIFRRSLKNNNSEMDGNGATATKLINYFQDIFHKARSVRPNNKDNKSKTTKSTIIPQIEQRIAEHDDYENERWSKNKLFSNELKKLDEKSGDEGTSQTSLGRPTIRKEVGIMNKILSWLKDVATNKTENMNTVS